MDYGLWSMYGWGMVCLRRYYFNKMLLLRLGDIGTKLITIIEHNDESQLKAVLAYLIG